MMAKGTYARVLLATGDHPAEALTFGRFRGCTSAR